MAEPAPKASLTFDDVRQLSDEFQGELDRGEWIDVTPPTPRHGEIMLQVAFALKMYLLTNPIGRAACGDPGVELTHDPDTLRGPDVIFVANERLPGGQMPDDWLAFAPDLAVEVLSKSQSFGEAAQRAREYLAAGSRLVWVVEPKTQSVAVFTPDGRVETFRSYDELEGGDVLPGFHYEVSQLFA